MEIRRSVKLGLCVVLVVASCAGSEQEIAVAQDASRVQPYKANPHYWQYKSKPLLLLGGSDDDNLFQWTGARLIEQLNLLKSVGVNVQTTEMWYDQLDKNPPIPHATFDDPETYSFVDVLQNSIKRGQQHWGSLRLQLSRVADNVRPLTNVKICGADTGPERWFRADVDGVERFWRNIFGGMASTRFHRPPYGLGLTDKAQVNIRSLRLLTDDMDIFTCAARNDLLSDRKPNEAYCLSFSMTRLTAGFCYSVDPG